MTIPKPISSHVARLFGGAKAQTSGAPQDMPRAHACPDCGGQQRLSVLFQLRAPLRHRDGADVPVMEGPRVTDAHGLRCGDCGWIGSLGSARLNNLDAA